MFKIHVLFFFIYTSPFHVYLHVYHPVYVLVFVFTLNVPSPDCCLRTCLIYLLILARGGTFFLEQPASSLMRHSFRFQFLAERTKASGHGVSLQVRSTRLYIYIYSTILYIYIHFQIYKHEYMYMHVYICSRTMQT